MSSNDIFASSAITSPAPVTTSGLISTIAQSSAMEGAVHRHDELAEDAELLAFEPEREGEAARMEARDARGRIDRDAEDLLGMVLGDLLDLHAAFGRGHDRDAAGGAIDEQGEIELAPDVAAGLDIDAMHLPARAARSAW